MRIKNNHHSTFFKIVFKTLSLICTAAVYILCNNNKRLIYFSHKKNISCT